MVHEQHGIGQYLGIRTLTVAGVTKDYITVKYAGKDSLYLPCDQLDKLSKYTGKSENVPLSKMGGSEWIKKKSRAKKAAKDMAKELIALYAERKRCIRDRSEIYCHLSPASPYMTATQR